jgi:7,8-dihydropterin-6-yl-methyl-4-(beta-D-ribofuranosyl)aminobenzene 5'-phosphate synthase
VFRKQQRQTITMKIEGGLGMVTLNIAERVQVQVLVDNVTDQLSTNPAQVQSERVGLLQAGMAEYAGENICCAHFGLSLVITAHSQGVQHTVLFDAGPEGYAVERNGTRLGVDFGAIESVVLSHGHWDHAGGLTKALELIRTHNGGREVPYYMHLGMFRQRGTKLPNDEVLPHKPLPSVETLTAGGAAVISSPDSQIFLDDLFYVSGEIPRITPYERGMPPAHLRRTDDGTGWEHDQWIRDERFVAVQVRDKGLVVFTACSHAGVVNVLTHARTMFPDTPLHAVMGGLHLSGPGPEKIIPETVQGLTEFGLQMIVPAHCTGWRAVIALVNTFGEEIVVPAAVGKRYTF